MSKHYELFLKHPADKKQVKDTIQFKKLLSIPGYNPYKNGLNVLVVEKIPEFIYEDAVEYLENWVDYCKAKDRASFHLDKVLRGMDYLSEEGE